VKNTAPSNTEMANGYAVAMATARPFPANHGSVASIREMSDTLSDMGHSVHIVTYPTGQEEMRSRRVRVRQTAAFRPESNAKVGSSSEKFGLEFQLLRLLYRVIRSEQLDIIRAHNCEDAFVGIVTTWLTGRPRRPVWSARCVSPRLRPQWST
jgi:Glycosyltransferase Family 4